MFTGELNPERPSGLRSRGRRRRLVRVRIPGRAARAVRGGAVLAPEGTLGRRTWEEFLADQPG